MHLLYFAIDWAPLDVSVIESGNGPAIHDVL